jgi:hypothetical protein
MSFGKNCYKGLFKPKNPQKYKGDPNNVVYRSSWELRLMKYLDEHPATIWWASEELPIPYVSPLDNKVHRYFPDFIVRMKRKAGQETTMVLEVKPDAQTKMPTQKRKTKRYLTEVATFAVNQEKWKAADLFCKEHGWIFKIITEKDLGI